MIINLIKKADNEILVTKKIKIKVVPRETITKLILTDATNLRNCEYDGDDSYEDDDKDGVKNRDEVRKVEDGKPLYLVVTSSCDASDDFKKIDLKVITSGGNLGNVPVNWSFDKQLRNGTITKIKSEISATNLTPFKFRTELSDQTLIGFNMPLEFYGIKINGISTYFKTPENLYLNANVNIFNDSKSSKLILVKNNPASIEFKWDMLSYESSKSTELKGFEKFLKTFKQKFKSIKDGVEALPLGDNEDDYNPNNSQKSKDFEFGTLIPSIEHNYSEITESRLYQENYKLKLKFVDSKWSYTNRIKLLRKLTKTNPLLNTIVGAAELIDVELFVDLNWGVSVGASLDVEFPYSKVLGDNLDGPLPSDFTFNESDLKFNLTPQIVPSFKPIIGVVGGNLFSAIGSFVVEAPMNFPISYNPSSTVLKFEEGYIDPIIAKEFSFIIKKNGVDYKRWQSDSSFEIVLKQTKTVLYSHYSFKFIE